MDMDADDHPNDNDFYPYDPTQWDNSSEPDDIKIRYMPEILVDGNLHLHVAWMYGELKDYGNYSKSEYYHAHYACFDVGGDEVISLKNETDICTNETLFYSYVSMDVDADNNVHVIIPLQVRSQDKPYSINYLRLDTDGNLIYPETTVMKTHVNAIIGKIDSNKTMHTIVKTWTHPLGSSADLWYGVFNTSASDGNLSYTHWCYIDRNFIGDFDETIVPNIALDSNSNVHIIWLDDFEGQSTVYYTTNVFKIEDHESDDAREEGDDNVFLFSVSIIIVFIILATILYIRKRKTKPESSTADLKVRTNM